MAILNVLDGDERTEVRGHPGVGVIYLGDGLDRVISGLPKGFNISTLFAGDVLHVRSGNGESVRELLYRENEITEFIFSSRYRERSLERKY